MAFLKLRLPIDDRSNAAPPESVEAVRRRARHRLIGSALLVLTGLVAIPLIFDAQPRPIPMDLPIVTPDRDRSKLASAPESQAEPPNRSVKPSIVEDKDKIESKAPKLAAAATVAAAAAAAIVVPKLAAAKPKPAPTSAPVTEAKITAKPQTKPVPVVKPQARPEAASDVKTATQQAHNAPPKTSPDSKKPGESANEAKLAENKKGRFIVQTGIYSFAEIEKARASRRKIEQAGIKTYTQVAGEGVGRKIRVRIGPFANKAEADRAAKKMKALGLTDGIYEL